MRFSVVCLVILTAGLVLAQSGVPVPGPVTVVPTDEDFGVPRLVNYQGKLLDSQGRAVRDSTYPVAFRFYTVPTGGSAWWTEIQSVHTAGGLFSVLLGSSTPLDSVPKGGNCYLSMQLSPDPEMTPRVRIASAPYAYYARRADSADYAPGGGGSNFWNQDGSHNYIYPITPGSNQRVQVWKPGGMYGIYGSTSARNGYGVYGFADTAGGYAVYGSAGRDSTSSVRGTSTFNNTTGILGAGANAPGGPCGVYGYSYREDLCAGLFYNQLGTVTTRIGYYDNMLYRHYGLNTTGDVLVGGNFWVTGSKSAVVNTRDFGRRVLYCTESPEVWFEDFGSARLIDGRAHIELDPIFRQTVVIDAQNPLKVFVTPTSGEAIALGVRKGLTGFDVVGPNGATVEFDWRVVAKRAGYEDRRLEPENER